MARIPLLKYAYARDIHTYESIYYRKSPILLLSRILFGGKDVDYKDKQTLDDDRPVAKPIEQPITVAPSNAPARQFAEMAAILDNEKRAKAAARSLALQTLYTPMQRPKERYITLKDGSLVQTEDSIKEQEAWDRCKATLDMMGKHDQNPTMWDVMNNGQAFAGITNASNYAAIRDTAGLKPIDETKMTLIPENPYASMTDQELLIAKKIQDMPEEERQAWLAGKKEE